MTMAEAVDRLPRRMATWAASRPLAPNSMTGISVALGLCAAAWFTAGTRPGNVTGALVLCGGYLVSHCAQGFGALGGSGAGARAPGAGARARGAATAAKAASDARLARACAVLADCGIYAGLAAGGAAVAGSVANVHAAASSVTGGLAAGRIGMWQLATTLVVVLAVGQLAAACGGRPPSAGERAASFSGVTRRILACPYGGRVLLIAIAAPAWGTRAALLGLLAWAVVAAIYAIVSGRPRHAGTTGTGAAITGTRADTTRNGTASAASTASMAIVACRDDGPVAKRIGLPIRGQLVPLPPAVTGVAAVTVLAVLGLHSLPGFLLLAPVVAMLLATVGSSHPHDGRLDWIVPAMLQAGQFAYIAAIGFASAVPAPLIFALCALIALHYADLAGHTQQRTAMGWEGRMIAIGLGAALGIATFACLLLAAYVVVLICREIMTSWLAATEGDRR
jgi:hypothetical protein